MTAPQRAPLAAYACVVSKRHVREPYELSQSEMIDFFEDCMYAAKRLSQAFQPVKMNYEIHGNTISHLHMHLFPRMPEDFGRPIPTGAVYKRSRAELDLIASAVRRQKT